MSELANMEVKVTADISSLTRQLSAANIQLIKTGQAFESLSKDALQASGYFVRLPQPLNNTSKALGAAAIQAANLDSKLARGLTKSSDTATFALTNLGRVVQDLPYGFLGIANNLNPLLESFQRLRTETGGNMLALKALAGSLVGAGGLGLALSLGTTLIQLFTTGFMNFSKQAKQSKKDADEAAESFKAITEELGKEAASVAVIVEQLKTEVLTRKQRTAAIEELQRISPTYFATLNAEKATIEQITAAYDDYSAAIIRSIEAKVREKQLEDVVTKRVALQSKLNDEVKKTVTVTGEAGKASIITAGGVTGAVKVLTEAERKRADELRKDSDQVQAYLEQEKQLVQEIAQIKPIDFKVKADAKGSTKDIETLAEMIAEMRKQLAFLENREIVFGTDEAENKIRVLDNAIEELFKKFNQTAKSQIVINLQGEIADIRLKQNIKFEDPKNFKVDLPPGSIQIEITPEIITPMKNIMSDADFDSWKKIAYLKAIGVTHGIQDGLRVGVEGLRFPQLDSLYNSMVSVMDQFNARANALVLSTINSAFSGIGEAIGTSIAEGLPLGEQIFGNLFKVLADGMKQLGESMIALGTAKVVVEKFAVTPGVGTIVAGIAITAIAAALRSSLPRFATGGSVNPLQPFERKQGKITGPGTSTSDSIPALLSNGEYVIKADSVKKYGTQFFENLNQQRIDKSITSTQFNKAISETTNNFTSNKISNNLSSTVKKFASGGPVSNHSMMTIQKYVNGGSVQMLSDAKVFNTISKYAYGGMVTPIRNNYSTVEHYPISGAGGVERIEVFGSIKAKGSDLLVTIDRAEKTKNRNS